MESPQRVCEYKFHGGDGSAPLVIDGLGRRCPYRRQLQARSHPGSRQAPPATSCFESAELDRAGLTTAEASSELVTLDWW